MKTKVNFKGLWIHWRWKNNGSKTLARDFVQDQYNGILDLSDSPWPTHYPTRVLLKEIEIFNVEKP